MGLFDSYFDQGGGILAGLPPWATMSIAPPSPDWLKTALGNPTPGSFPSMPQEAQLPPNAQPAALQPPGPLAQPADPYGPRKSIWTPQDGYAGDPPVNPDAPQPTQSPMQAFPQAPALGAPSAPQQQRGSGGGLLGGLGEFLLGTLATGSPFAGVSAALNRGNKQQTYDALIASGVPAQQAWFIVNDPKSGQLAGLISGSDTADIKEFEYAKRQGYKGTFQDWMAAKRAGAGEYGLTPIWGTDAEGKPAFLQPGKNGTPIQPQLPKGFQISRDPIKVEGPTGTAILDPQTRQQVGFIPKDVAGAARQKEVGEAQGTAQVNVGNVVATGERTLKLIDDLEKHPGLPTATGLSGKLDPHNYIAGTDAANFEVRRKQLLGGTFLEAYQSLKGGGAITEVEGQKAQDAISRMDRTQSEQEFRTALREYKDIVKQGMERAKAKASGNFGATPAPAASGAPQRIKIDASGNIIP